MRVVLPLLMLTTREQLPPLFHSAQPEQGSAIAQGLHPAQMIGTRTGQQWWQAVQGQLTRRRWRHVHSTWQSCQSKWL